MQAVKQRQQHRVAQHQQQELQLHQQLNNQDCCKKLDRQQAISKKDSNKGQVNQLLQILKHRPLRQILNLQHNQLKLQQQEHNSQHQHQQVLRMLKLRPVLTS